jgi:hypothetical protein
MLYRAKTGCYLQQKQMLYKAIAYAIFSQQLLKMLYRAKPMLSPAIIDVI